MGCVMEILKRSEAIEKGLKIFCNGIPCKNGVISLRNISGRCLCDICKLERSKKTQEWKKRNPQKHSLNNLNYVKRNKDSVIERDRKWRDNNRDYLNKAKKEWDKKNRDATSRYASNNRAKRKNAIPSWFNELDNFILKEAFDLCKKREISTGIKWHVDHMIPLNAKEACGLHCRDNIQVIPQRLNNIKINKMLFTNTFEWITRL